MIVDDNMIPMLYHPSNVLFLDDDMTVLNNLSLKLDEKFPYVLFSDPEEALTYLDTHKLSIEDISEKLCKENFENPISDEFKESFDVSFHELTSDLNKPDRFKKVIVLVVDYNMPKMTGDKFCHKVRERNIPCKIILLTGAAGTQEAIKAFNENIIDVYMSKDDEDLYANLNQQIDRLAYEFFNEFSYQLGGLVRHKMKMLDKLDWKKFFYESMKSQSAVEYYMTSPSGQYVLINQKGESSNFVLVSENDFEEVIEIAKNGGASKESIESLKQRKKFPFKDSNKNAYLKLFNSDWDYNLVEVNKIADGSLYYFNVKNNKVDVFPFNNYMEKVWPEP